MQQSSSPTVPVAGALITLMGAILFSTKAIIVKKAFAEVAVDALTLLTLRMFLSLPFYLAAAYISAGKKGVNTLKPQQWLTVVMLGIFGYYLSSLFDFIGLQYISAGLERLILFLYPTFTVLINVFVFKQPFYKLQKIALLLTYTGIAIAYFGEAHIDNSNPKFYYGSLLILLCAVTYSIYIVGSGRIIPVIGTTKFTAYAMLSATIGIFIHFALRGNYHLLQSDSKLWWYGLLIAIVATVVPSFMLAEGLRRIGTNNVAIISAVGPVSTIVQAHIFLNEPVFFEQIIGTLLVIAGIVIIGWRKRTKTAQTI